MQLDLQEPFWKVSDAAKGFVIVCVEQPEDGFVLRPGSTIRGKGWVLASVDVEQICIFLGKQLLGYASYGEFRPEIAERFPTYVHADQSGFSFSVRTPREAVDGAEDITVVVRTVNGLEKSRVVSAGQSVGTLSDPAGKKETEFNNAALWPIRLFLEDARIDDAGVLQVRGWTLSRALLRELRVFLGAQPLGLPEIGLLRPDVALIYPDYPDAENCGFRLVQQVDGEIGQNPVLRVQALCEGGVKRQIMAPVTRRSRGRKASDVGGTQFCCDVASVDSRGNVLASGWAIAESGVVGIGIDLDGALLGDAKIGLARPDVGNRFPRVPSARNAGFQFSHELGVALDGEHTLTFRVRDGSGAEQEIPLPVQAQEVAQDLFSLETTATEVIRFSIDRPALSGEQARDPIRTTLNIEGWATTASGIEHVEVIIDGQSLGYAYYGQRREDIAAAFPEHPDALLSGFASVIPVHAIGLGDHSVSVVFRSKNGETVGEHFSIHCEKSDSIIASEIVRPKISQAEIDHGLSVLDRRGHQFFDIRIRLDDLSEAGLQQAQDTLASLHAQAYPNWRASFDVPPQVDSTEVIERLAFRAGCKASELLQGAGAMDLEQAGESSLVCLLRAGDRLGVNALLEFAIHAASTPNDDLFYSDDRRRDPTTGDDAAFFKPDWSPDLLMSFNYIGRSWCARGSLLKSAGIETRDLGSLGEYDAVLRLTERAQSVGHLPRLLLHEAERERNWTAEGQALADAVGRRGLAARIEIGRAKGAFRAVREVTAPGRVSVIIPTIAARGLIEIAIRGLREKTDWPDIEIVCIDNIPPGRDLYWKTWLRENADKVCELDEPFNWSRLNNIGAAASTGDYLLFLNDDIEVVHPEWLRVLVSHAQRSEVGVVGPQLLYPDGRVQHSGMFLTGAGFRHAFRFAPGDEPGPFGIALSERNVLSVTGACLLVRRGAFEKLGGFNERHSVVANDTDFCLRAQRSGLHVVFTPYSTLHHHELASRAKIADVFDNAQFHADWGTQLLKGDPYFNRNLGEEGDMWSPEPEPIEVVYAGHPVVGRDRVQRILAVKLDHLGDFITTFPALRRLKERFPEAELHVLCATGSLGLAKLEPCIDRVLPFDWFHDRSAEGEREVGEEELLGLRDRLAPLRFDVAIDLRLHPDTRRVLQYTGARLLAGFEYDDRFPWLDVVLAWEGDVAGRAKRTHISDRQMQLVEAVSIACESDRTSLATISAATARAYVNGLRSIGDAGRDFFSGTVACVHPGVGNDIRQWPAERFASLIDLLVDDLGAKVVVIGARAEEEVANRVLDKVTFPESVLSLVGKTKIQDLPYVLRACSLYVGNNSGPKHLAAALGVPTVGVHSAVVQASEWGPVGPNAVALRRRTLCGPCYLPSASQCTRKLACLTGLRPILVYEMCRRLLEAA